MPSSGLASCSARPPAPRRWTPTSASGCWRSRTDEYGYLIYPHRPLVAYDAATGELLSEYCVRFLDGSDPEAGERLPDADDVLAKWMALRADEHELIRTANVHPLGRQLDPDMVRRDLEAVRQWRR